MTGSTRLRVTTERGVLVAALHGDLAFDLVTDAEQGLRAAVGPASAALVVDLAGVRFLDSRALQMLFALHEDAVRHRRLLLIVLPPGAPGRRALELAGAGAAELVLVPTRAAAIEQALACWPPAG